MFWFWAKTFFSVGKETTWPQNAGVYSPRFPSAIWPCFGPRQSKLLFNWKSSHVPKEDSSTETLKLVVVVPIVLSYYHASSIVFCRFFCENVFRIFLSRANIAPDKKPWEKFFPSLYNYSTDCCHWGVTAECSDFCF